MNSINFAFSQYSIALYFDRCSRAHSLLEAVLADFLSRYFLFRYRKTKIYALFSRDILDFEKADFLSLLDKFSLDFIDLTACKSKEILAIETNKDSYCKVLAGSLSNFRPRFYPYSYRKNFLFCGSQQSEFISISSILLNQQEIDFSSSLQYPVDLALVPASQLNVVNDEIVASALSYDKAPFRFVVVLGDLENALDFNSLFKEFSLDVIRLCLLSQFAPYKPTFLSSDILQKTRDKILTIISVLDLALSIVVDSDCSILSYSDLLLDDFDKYIISMINGVSRDVWMLADFFDFSTMFNSLDNLLTLDYRQYLNYKMQQTLSQHSVSVIYYTLKSCLILFSHFCPDVSNKLYTRLPCHRSSILEEKAESFSHFKASRELVKKMRKLFR